MSKRDINECQTVEQARQIHDNDPEMKQSLIEAFLEVGQIRFETMGLTFWVSRGVDFETAINFVTSCSKLAQEYISKEYAA